MSNPNIDAVTLEFSWDVTQICLTVVIWEHHLGLDDFCSLNQLVWCHRIGLIARQEGNVDVLDGIFVEVINAANKQVRIFFIS